MGIPSLPDPFGQLDRHQRRRDEGQPAATALAGRVDLGAGLARRWADQRGRATILVADPGAGAMADAWAAGVASGLGLARLAVGRIAASRGDDPAALAARLARMGPVERGRFLDSGATGPAARWLLERSGPREDLAAPGLASRLGGAIGGRDGLPPEERGLAALGELVPPGSAPVLLAAPVDAPDPAAWLAVAARSLARLALAWPRLPALLAVAPGDLDDYLRLAPESREKALIRSGIVVVPDPGSAGDAIGPSPAGPDPAGVPTPSPPESADEGARSEAELYLFRALEAAPDTSGLFALNANVDIPFGPGRAMEVDLLAPGPKIAIEVDGYYHFQGPDSYRRDRRKDFLLQLRGYLVIRVLAEDVVSRLEEILGLVRDAITSRSPRPSAPNRDARP